MPCKHSFLHFGLHLYLQVSVPLSVIKIYFLILNLYICEATLFLIQIQNPLLIMRSISFFRRGGASHISVASHIFRSRSYMCTHMHLMHTIQEAKN